MELLTVIGVIFVMVSYSNVNGALFRGEIQTVEENGRTVKYCEYTIAGTNATLKLLPRSVFKDYDQCTKCSCKRDGLFCATMGSTITVHDENPKCFVVKVACKNKWRMIANPNKRCPKRLRPTNISAIGK